MWVTLTECHNWRHHTQYMTGLEMTFIVKVHAYTYTYRHYRDITGFLHGDVYTRHIII